MNTKHNVTEWQVGDIVLCRNNNNKIPEPALFDLTMCVDAVKGNKVSVTVINGGWEGILDVKDNSLFVRRTSKTVDNVATLHVLSGTLQSNKS